MVGINMRFKTRVKLGHLSSKRPAKIKHILRGLMWTSAPRAGKGASHLQHNFCLSLFNFQKWKEFCGNIRKKISCHVDFVSEMVAVFHSIFVKFSDTTAKRLQYPFQHFSTIVRNLKNAVIVGIPITGAFGCVDVMANEKAAFPIDESSQISQIQFSDFRKVIGFEFRHQESFVENSRSLNEGQLINHAERLNKVTFLKEKMRQSELCGNVERESRRTFPAIEIWSVGKAKPKVTECLNESARLLSENMGETLDEITRDVLASTSSIYQCANGTNGSTPSDLSSVDLDSATKTLLGNDAKMISKVMTGSRDYGTTPIRPAFFGFIDTDLLDDLEAVDSFVPTSTYSKDRALDAEWGNTKNIRWLYTSIGSVSSASPPVYNNIVVGQEAYGCIHLRSESGNFYIEPLGSSGAADPLHQRGTVGWDHPYVARVLNDSFMLNVMATHS